MNGSPNVRTRKQAASAKQEIDTPTMNGHANGDANGSAHLSRSDKGNETHENIFLFWPNVIGKPVSFPSLPMSEKAEVGES